MRDPALDVERLVSRTCTRIYRQTLYNCTRFKTPTSRARRCAQWAPGSCLRLVSSPTWTAQAVVGGSGHPPTAKVSCRHAKESGRRKRSRHSSPKMAARNEFRARCALLACTSHTARLAFPCPAPSSTITLYKPGRSYYILLMFSQCVVLWSASGDDLLGFLTAPNLVQLYKILVHEPSL